MNETKCKQCGIQFEQKRYGKDKTIFCSVTCSVIWQKDNLTKPLNLSGKKICISCNIEKDYNEFRLKGKSNRFHSYCKKCLYIFQMRRWNKKKISAVAYKGGKCIKCGSIEHPVNFDFHHRNPNEKSFDWSIMRRFSQTKINSELDKCDLLCVRCHRLLTVDDNLWPLGVTHK